MIQHITTDSTPPNFAVEIFAKHRAESLEKFEHATFEDLDAAWRDVQASLDKTHPNGYCARRCKDLAKRDAIKEIARKKGYSIGGYAAPR